MSAKDIRRDTPHVRLMLRVALVLLASFLGWLNGLGRADQLIYDRTISLFSRPAPQDVLIVTIDDEAIDTLGRWPWPRSLHSMLLERLQGARAVGLDIVFSESDANSIADDQLLANAVRQHGRVVLPLVLNNVSHPTHANLPIAPLAEAAAGLGYINVTPDDDGVLRAATWRSATGTSRWQPFALSMLNVGGEKSKVDEFLQQLPPTGQTLIPYAGGPGHFKKISYLSVLRGELTPEAVKDKYVLVGAWATGLGDIFPSPVSHDVNGIPGVEVIANLLHGARQNTAMVPAKNWQTALASALPVLLLCLALPKLSPRQAIFYSLAALIMILFIVALILYIGHVWIPPAAALLGVAISYPIWSWRSQEAALRYMNREVRRLRVEYPPVLDENTQPINTAIGLSLDQQIDELDRTLAHVRNLRRFVTDGLDGIPDVNMVIDSAGMLRYRNRPAVTYFVRLGIRPPRIGKAIIPALEQACPTLVANEHILHALRAHSDHQDQYPSSDKRQPESSRLTIELRDRADHDLLFRCSPIRTATGAHAGLVVNISDVSAVRQAERQREQTLQFISHDMRAPQNSILALVELHRRESSAEQPSDVVFNRIESLANRTLQLVDNFIELTRAESMSIAYDQMDLVALLYEIADDFWATSQPRKITLHVQSSSAIALTCGDTSLIRRALSNLIDNAIKYSPNNSSIYIQITAKLNTWDIDIQDAGPGIPIDEQKDLFKPFFRTKAAQSSSTEGSGLGLAFVHTVAQRHGGSVTLRSSSGKGARFTFSVPFAIEDDAED